MGTTDTYCNATTLAVHGALQIWSASSSTLAGTSSRIDKPGQVPSSGMATSSTSSEITSPTPLASTGTRARTARGNHTLSARDAPSTTDVDRKSPRLTSSHQVATPMPSSASTTKDTKTLIK